MKIYNIHTYIHTYIIAVILFFTSNSIYAQSHQGFIEYTIVNETGYTVNLGHYVQSCSYLSQPNGSGIPTSIPSLKSVTIDAHIYTSDTSGKACNASGNFPYEFSYQGVVYGCGVEYSWANWASDTSTPTTKLDTFGNNPRKFYCSSTPDVTKTNDQVKYTIHIVQA